MVFIRSMRDAAASSQRSREEVVGKGSGETAGGSPECGLECSGESTAKQPGAEGSRKAAGRDRARLTSEERTTPSADGPRPPESISKGVANAHPFTGGEDTVEISLYVAWNPYWSFLQEFFDERKRDAQSTKGDRGLFEIGGWNFEMLPSGAGGRSGMVAKYLLNVAGMQFRITTGHSPNGDTPNVSVRIGSVALMTQGLERCLADIHAFLDLFGGLLLENKLSRVDSCIDLPGVPMDRFAKAMSQRHYICRAKLAQHFLDGADMTSVSIGKEPKCRIYDKVAELHARTDVPKLQAILNARWNGEFPETATRIEWQIRRKTIKQFGINSVEDWIEKRSGVFNYLFEWLRILDTEGRKFDPQNSDRYPTLELWKMAHEVFLNWSNSPIQTVERRRSKQDASPQRIRDMLGGCALSLVARQEREWDGLDNFERQVLEQLRRWIAKKTPEEVEREFQLRQSAFLAKLPPSEDLEMPDRSLRQDWATWLAELVPDAFNKFEDDDHDTSGKAAA
ncbi:hypothetical protein [Bremerella cremea]|uniref:hypothetical protein n=1 Tax=Bremerella cremea TaxID=1031537 RepID=UPI0031ED804F